MTLASPNEATTSATSPSFPLSETSTSISPTVWASALATHSRSRSGLRYVGIAMVTFGAQTTTHSAGTVESRVRETCEAGEEFVHIAPIVLIAATQKYSR